MKTFLTIALLLVSVGAFARDVGPTVVRTQLLDDGNTLTIRIDGHRAGRAIHLYRTHDVAGTNRWQKEAFKLRAFLAVGLVPPFHEIAALTLTVVGLILLGIALVVTKRQQVRTLTPKWPHPHPLT